MERFDIAIIGTGPAGLEAAITAKVRNKSVLLIGGKDSSDKVSKAHTIQNYLGLPDVAGADMAKAFLDHATGMGIEITEDKVNAKASVTVNSDVAGTEGYEAGANAYASDG